MGRKRKTDEEKELIMYRERDIRIKPFKQFLFEYCDRASALSNNLANAVRFRQRQVLTATHKDEKDWTDNEREIMEEIRTALPKMGDKYEMPTKENSNMSDEFLDTLMRVTNNPDRRAQGLSSQSAQKTIKQCVLDMETFYDGMSEYKEDPSKFTGKPNLPGYKKKGGRNIVIFTNQDAVLHEIDGKWFLKLPFIHQKEYWVPFGEVVPNTKFKMAKLIPDNGTYILRLVFEVLEEKKEPVKESKRIAAGDLGVENLMAVTNNVGLPCLLYKGGVVKSINQRYNKRLAAIMSEQTKGTKKKFSPTPESMAITIERNDSIHDVLHKTAKHFINWCVENRIDTVVIGVNKGQKQSICIGHVNDQNFVQIPFAFLRMCIKYLCERYGIRYIEQEESYTSKASFIDNDYIPTYGKDDENAQFSGKRAPTRYNGNYKKGGFRGLYITKDGIIINSDLNGSANILRKAFPDAFKKGKTVDFKSVIVIKHPEYDKWRKAFDERKKAAAGKEISKSKGRRLKKKEAAKKAA